MAQASSVVRAVRVAMNGNFVDGIVDSPRTDGRHLNAESATPLATLQTETPRNCATCLSSATAICVPDWRDVLRHLSVVVAGGLCTLNSSFGMPKSRGCPGSHRTRTFGIVAGPPKVHR
jgi:hypothetical protein